MSRLSVSRSVKNSSCGAWLFDLNVLILRKTDKFSL